jgi:hypothetical protein
VKPINILLSLLSLNALVIIIERLSPTTKIILQPYSFLRLHEVFQMLVIIPFSFIISFLLLKVTTDNFRLLKNKNGIVLGSIFILGLYFTATGNGVHEMASFIYSTFCNAKTMQTPLCGGTYFNTYYFGNIVYFIGLLLSNIVLILFERDNPQEEFTKKDLGITLVNGAVYALTLFAYGAFDVVLVGLGFCFVMAILVDYLLVSAKHKPHLLPFTLYSAVAYTLSTVAILFVRFH